MLEAAGAVFSMVAVVPRDKLNVTSGREAEDRRQQRGHQRYACSGCACTCTAVSRTRVIVLRSRFRAHRAVGGRRLVGPESPLRVGIIESGFEPAKMGQVRARLKELGLERTMLCRRRDGCHPTHVAKTKGVLKA